MPITHAHVNPKPDGGDTDQTQPSDWNAAHVGGVDSPLTEDLVADGFAIRGSADAGNEPGSVSVADGDSGDDIGGSATLTGGASAAGNLGAVIEVGGGDDDAGQGGIIAMDGGAGTSGNDGGSFILRGGTGDGGLALGAELQASGGSGGGGAGRVSITTDALTGAAGQGLTSDGAGGVVWAGVQTAAGVPTGNPTGLPFAYDTTAVTGGFYYWNGSAWVKVATIL